jgi:magnesium-transporting ATPase (P-type)
VSKNHFINALNLNKTQIMEDITLDDSDLEKGTDGLTVSMKNNLKEAFNWMRIVSIISFIGMGLMVIFWLKTYSEIPSYAARQLAGPMVLFVVFGVGQVLLILTLLKASTAFKAFLTSGASADLELAFKKQKQFWLATGIVAIICAFFFLIGFAQVMSISNNRLF